MSRTRKIPVPISPTTREVMEYLKDQLFQGLKTTRQTVMEPAFLSVNIGLGCPHYPVEVSIRFYDLERQAAKILNDLGIPDALDTWGSYQDFRKSQMSISGHSLDVFGKANREKILEWVAQQSASNGEEVA